MAQDRYDAIVVGARCAGSPTGDAARPQGLPSARRRPCDVPERHAVDPPPSPAGRRGAASDGACSIGWRRRDVRRSTRTRSTSARSRSRARPAPPTLRSRTARGAQCSTSCSSTRRPKRAPRFARSSPSKTSSSTTDASPAFAATTRAAQPSPSTPTSSSARTAATRSSRRPSVPSSTTSDREILSGYYAYWSDLAVDGTLRGVRAAGSRLGCGADPRRPDACRRRLAVRRVRRQQGRRRGELPADVRSGARVRGSHPRRRSAKHASRAPPSPNYFRKPYGPGWALVGDAGYNKDFITAQGISDAFRDAELCATAIDDAFSGTRSVRRRDGRVPGHTRRARPADVRVHLPACDARATTARDCSSCSAPCTATRRRWTASRASTPESPHRPSSSPKRTSAASSPPRPEHESTCARTGRLIRPRFERKAVPRNPLVSNSGRGAEGPLVARSFGPRRNSDDRTGTDRPTDRVCRPQQARHHP